MATPVKAVISLPGDFQFDEVPPAPRTTGAPVAPPSLGPIAAFVGNWSGNGFNTIFRPDSSVTPTPLPVPAVLDNLLELNLTRENLAFSASLGSVPNRGEGSQPDVFLNGVPYLQTVQDVTNPGSPVGIHVEPGIWAVVPSTVDPSEGPTVVRMASIPHGTTIEAQGTSVSFNGAPNIPSVDITPFVIGTNPPAFVSFPSQVAANGGTTRIPQDLTSFIAAGTITQAMLTDPNTVLRNHIKNQKIVATTAIYINTSPVAPIVGGGTDNIAFLQTNANAVKMSATFWIETVEVTIVIPPFKPGDQPLQLKAEGDDSGRPLPTFTVRPPIPIPIPRPITFTFTQIQYSQLVLLNFNGLSWPHVSVATLVRSDAVPINPGWD